MPNTPASIKEAMTAIAPNSKSSEDDIAFNGIPLFKSIGTDNSTG